MFNTVSHQLLSFTVTLLSGMVSSLLLHIYKELIPVKLKHYKSAGIIIIWVICSFITFLAIYFTTWGELRGYHLMGFSLGFIFYYVTFIKAIPKIILTIKNSIKNYKT